MDMKQQLNSNSQLQHTRLLSRISASLTGQTWPKVIPIESPEEEVSLFFPMPFTLIFHKTTETRSLKQSQIRIRFLGGSWQRQQSYRTFLRPKVSLFLDSRLMAFARSLRVCTRFVCSIFAPFDVSLSIFCSSKRSRPSCFNRHSSRQLQKSQYQPSKANQRRKRKEGEMREEAIN